jgi:SPP1 gp7 family putative phage head morphogenesis protein
MAVDPVRQLLDYSVMHQINLSRFAGKQVRDVITLLNTADTELLDKISKRGERGPFTTARLKPLLTEIQQINADTYATAHNQMKKAMFDFAESEAETTAALLTKQTFTHFNIVQPNAEQLLAIVDRTPVTVGPDKSLLLEEVFLSLAAGKEEAIRGTIRLGMVQGKTVDQMVRRLRGSRAARFTDGVLEVSRRHAESMARTVVNHTSNRAVQMTYAANQDVVKGWEFLATLDARTTITCASLNGREFPIGQGLIPPQHVRCRSFALPVLKTWRELGIDLDELPPSVRASKDGPVSTQLSFSNWLKGQPHSVQKDILGATRAKLFREGGLTVDQFTDNAGVVYDLKELKARNKAAFDRVFV